MEQEQRNKKNNPFAICLRYANFGKTESVNLLPKYLLALLSLAVFVCPHAQNLVPNPGFEAYVECPDSVGEIGNCVDWGNGPYASSTDYFHACHATVPGMPQIQQTGVPDNYMGSLWAYGGGAYVGLVLYAGGSPFYREFVKNGLTAPMLAGIRYRVAFHAAFTCPVTNGNMLGMLVSQLPQPPMGAPLVSATLNPTVTAPAFVWTEWEDIYVASGGERYISIGNFNTDALTTGITRTTVPVNMYAFIDEVSVMPVGQDVSVCQGDSVTLTAQGAPGYIWIAAADTAGTVLSTSATFRAGPGTTTSYIAYGATDTLVYNVYVNPRPQVFLGNDTLLCRGAALPLDVTIPGATYQWNNGVTAPAYTVETPGTYAVEVTSGACTVTDSIRVDYENCHCTLYIPSAFTPDADNTNENFAPIPTADCELAEYLLGIYDGWGHLLYQTDNSDQPWEGTFNGTGLPLGLYTYRVAYRFKGDTLRFRNGSVMLGR